MADHNRHNVPGMREWQMRTDMMCNWYERMTYHNRHDVPGMREWQIITDMMCLV